MTAPALEALRGVRDERGRFCTGSPGPRLTHGLQSASLADVPELAAAHQELVAEIERDLGGDLSAIKRAAVRELARLMLIADSLGVDLFARGVLTGKGRTRAVVQVYGMVEDRRHRLALSLGYDRVPAKVASLRDYAKAAGE